MGDLNIGLDSIADFTGRIVLVTGGSSGIGLSIVRLLASKGATVTNLDWSAPPDDKLGNVEWLKTDVSDWDAQLFAFKSTIAKHGRIDTVIANAAIAEGDMAFEDKVDSAGDPLEPTWSTLNINLLGILITTKLAIHYFKKLGVDGDIVMTGSRSSYAGWSMPVYTATKHGIIGLLRGLRQQVPRWNIRINVIAPHVTDTGMTAENRRLFDEANFPMQNADHVAVAAAYLAQEKSLNGKVIGITQGRYHEIEGKLDELRWDIFGQDDLEPRTGPELKALQSIQYSRW